MFRVRRSVRKCIVEHRKSTTSHEIHDCVRTKVCVCVCMYVCVHVCVVGVPAIKLILLKLLLGEQNKNMSYKPRVHRT